MSELAKFKDLKTREFSTAWRSPSNIAFVKYWGKKGHQLPANPSLSMTLKECFTETLMDIKPSETMKVELFLDGMKEERFATKIENYFLTFASDLPWIKKLTFSIKTKNTFPHGTGIASSASGLSALALCLTEYLHALSDEPQETFFQRASFLSRLASGSACRSIYGGFATWGDESDLYASPMKVHSELSYLLDTVVVVSSVEKQVSSRAGHERMKEHAFAEARFVQAKNNYQRMKNVMLSGDIEELGRILEAEALSLHAMMMTSPDAFTLLKPNSLAAMELIRSFRQETKLPLYFTLDAGPNLHLIYPPAASNKIETFIKNELKVLASSIIYDGTGQGPEKCK